MKIGIYGGTFDPPHLGHMNSAKAAMEILQLDKRICKVEVVVCTTEQLKYKAHLILKIVKK